MKNAAKLLCVLLIASCKYVTVTEGENDHGVCSDGSVDVPPDALPPMDLVTPWVRHEIYKSTLSGADGVNIATINGSMAITSPWEQSSKVTVSLMHPTDPTMVWPTVILPGAISAPEDSVFADVDNDGAMDVITVGDGSKKIWISFGPTNPADTLTAAAWTTITLNAATNVQNWLQAAHADLNGDSVKDIVAGGRVGAGAAVGYFTTTDPRNASAYTWVPVAAVGTLWSLIPRDVDVDGDLDLVISDNAQIGADTTRMGTRWLENPGTGTWTNHQIFNYKGADQLARFMHADALRVIDGSSRDTGASFLNIRTTTDWLTWSVTNVPYPSNSGHYNAVRPADIDQDGNEDLVISMHHADTDYTTAPEDLSGVLWLQSDGAGGWNRGEISGDPGIKYDNVELRDIDGDGDLDVIVTEQGMAGTTPAADKHGLEWYENPRL